MKITENKMAITLNGDGINKNFNLPLLDLPGKQPQRPGLELDSRVEVDAGILAEALEDCSVIAESTQFNMVKDSFWIVAKGNLTQAKIDLVHTEKTPVVITSFVKAYKCKYSLEYLNKIMKARKISGRCVIRFKGEYPLNMVFANEHGTKMEFILAPRVDNSE
jgi:hypothetical protein